MVVFGLLYFITSATAPEGGGSSQTPAIVAIMVATASAIATILSAYRQSRQDKVASAAVHSNAAIEANRQSFEQIMATVKFLSTQNAELQESNRKLMQRVDELEDRLELLTEENEHLRDIVRKTGGTW